MWIVLTFIENTRVTDSPSLWTRKKTDREHNTFRFIPPCDADTLRAPAELVIVAYSGHNVRSVDAAIAPTRDEIIDATVDFLARHLDALPKKYRTEHLPSKHTQS